MKKLFISFLHYSPIQETMKFNLLLSSVFLLLILPSISAFPLGNITRALSNITSGWNAFNAYAGCHMGDHPDGLSKLKQYFHKFGYIPDSNWTDDFDESFESALKTYQLNFNLNTTGILDESTLKQIVKPRCGVPDIINGSTTMGQKKSTTSSHLHSLAHFTFFAGQPRWPSSNRQLRYAFFPENQLTDPVKAVFSRSFAKWSAVTPLTFTETDSFDTADITIGFFTGDHGDGEPFDGVLGTLAHAFSPPSGRFHLDGAENWVVGGDRGGSNTGVAVDLESVAVHEIGHLLGLGHSSDENAIMYPTILSGTRKIELGNDDIDGVQMLYGRNPNGSDESNKRPSTQERETNGAYNSRLDGHWVSMVGVALLLVSWL